MKESLPKLEDFHFNETVINEGNLNFIFETWGKFFKQIQLFNFDYATTDFIPKFLSSADIVSFEKCSKITDEGKKLLKLKLQEYSISPKSTIT